MRKYQIFIGGLGLVVVILTVISFMLMGNPMTQKLQAQDETILAEFSNIRNQIDSYYSDNKRVPETLDRLETAGYSKYEYRIISLTSYSLCANFLTDTKSVKPTPANYYYAKPMEEPDTRHSKGHDCITYKVSSYLVITPSPIASPTDIMTPLEAEQQILKATCSGQLKNGMCVYPGCMYTYPMNVYSKGKAVLTDSLAYPDSCMSVRGDVLKYYCTPRADKLGGYTVKSRIFLCEKGCADGACIK